ncbi:MAG TPA: hypothetical protein VI299_30280 [Polyangiales bacterium]
MLLLLCAPAMAQPSSPEEDLSARIEVLWHTPELDQSVRRPLELARAALQRWQAATDDATKTRTEGLARAAVELAEARMRALRERALLRAAQARRATSFAEKETARRALERERARVSQLERGDP